MTKQLLRIAAAMVICPLAFAQLDEIVEADHRPDAHKARNEFRNPVATLEFFEVEPDHTVIEIWPGAGWYTEILAPYLQDNGALYAAHFPADSDIEYFAKSRQKFLEKLADAPTVYSKVIVTEFGAGTEHAAAPPRTADRVLTFRNVHNWLKAGFADEAFVSFYDALKPGGILGVVEHRARPGTATEDMKTSGYVTEAYTIELATRAGFELVEKSEINANPKDTANHPEGVWTLPPSLRLGDKDREKYLDIGESDRMTLKFRKPAAEPQPEEN